MSGTKHDSGKARMSLLSAHALEEIAHIATFGAKKYDDHNWRKGFKWSRLLDAAQRHLNDYNKGKRIDTDPDCQGCQENNCLNHSGRSHLAAAAWNLMALLEFEKTGAGEDDLWCSKEIKGFGHFVKTDVKEGMLDNIPKVTKVFVPHGMTMMEAINTNQAIAIDKDLITGSEESDE